MLFETLCNCLPCKMQLAVPMSQLDALLSERDCHRVDGTITAGRGGVTLILFKQWRVMCYEQLRPRILIAEVMDKLDQRLTVLAAHFSEQAE